MEQTTEKSCSSKCKTVMHLLIFLGAFFTIVGLTIVALANISIILGFTLF